MWGLAALEEKKKDEVTEGNEDSESDEGLSGGEGSAADLGDEGCEKSSRCGIGLLSDCMQVRTV